MPIVFVHGVAIRAEGTPEWASLHHLTHGVHWPDIQALLRAHVAPVLNPSRPDTVSVSMLSWGDLGARYSSGSQFRSSQPDTRAKPMRLDGLDEAALGELTERRLCALAPLEAWPALVTAVWQTVRDVNVRALLGMTPPAGQWPLLQAAVLTRLHPDAAPEPFWPHLAAEAQLQQRRNVARAVARLRRPLEAFMPLFVGDVLCYLDGRGTGLHPGPIARRVTAGLLAAHQARQETGEPLVVVAHSMGGQLLYDALTAFLPADPALSGVRVDLCCVVGSQIGLFGELGLFLDEGPTGARPLRDSPHLGYFWNVWSASDLLSVPAEGSVDGAVDTAFPLTGLIQSDHVAYLHHPDFYRLLAAKVQIHGQPAGRHQPAPK